MSQRPRTALAVLSAFGVIGALLPSSAFAQSKDAAPAPPAAAPAASPAPSAGAEKASPAPQKGIQEVAANEYTAGASAGSAGASGEATGASNGTASGYVEKYEDKWVPWNSGGPGASFGLGLFAHLGVGHRFNHSPVPDAGTNSGASSNGLLIGIDAIVRINRYFGLGVGYEHADLGHDVINSSPTFSDIRRGLNNLWFQARVYPLRYDPFALYIDFAGGPSWQNIDTSRTTIDINSASNGTTTKCGAHSTAGLGLRGAVGGELSLVSGLTFFGELGPDGYLLSEKDLGGCGPGSGDAINIAFRGGFAFGMEKTHRKVVPGDTDKDGITDDKDACPNEPGVPNADPAKNGCPAPKDKDADGVLDDFDACPDIPGVPNSDPAKNGCPLPLDRDNDGITDDIDACPDTAGIKTEDPHTNGCPDKDGDTIVDPVDACPDVPGVKTEDPKTNGCPADTDGDGINDDKDACPKDPGKADPDPAKNGCPLVVVREGEIVIGEQVQFDTGKATIKPVSDLLLDTVAKVIKDHPEILKIEVQGHTDSKGSKGLNTQLSKDRAASVAKALVKRGVEDKRLTSHGYGPDQPIASNDTDEGRAKNRRVQFKILEKKGLDGAIKTMEMTPPASTPTSTPVHKSETVPAKPTTTPTTAPAKPATPATPPAKPAMKPTTTPAEPVAPPAKAPAPAAPNPKK